MGHGRKAYKRVAYISNKWALISDEVDPGILRRVPTRVAFFDCGYCGQLAGHRCMANGSRISGAHGDRGHGKHVKFEDRVAMAGGLIATKRFDEVQLLDVRGVLRKADDEDDDEG